VKAEAFSELLKSVREAGSIRRGELKPSRVTKFKPSRVTKFKPSDVKAVRARLGQSQVEFAVMIGVSVATLRNWEQGRRRPEGPALALLRVTAVNPRLVARALRGMGRKSAA
jgi:putative transcriptional regulator